MEDIEERPSRSWVMAFHDQSDGHKPDLVILRYGHGVLRNPDPRFIALQEFCKTRPDLQASPIIQLVQQVGIAVYVLN